MRTLPRYARLDRRLGRGDHPYLALLPHADKSPALRRIAPDASVRAALLAQAEVKICGPAGYAFVDVEAPRIVLSERYYATGDTIDLYLDLLHELTHLRQLGEGYDLWDRRFAYVDRPTEVEAYAVAVEEGRRLGMSPPQINRHLDNPWMSRAEVARLLRHIDRFLAGGPLPNLAAARSGAPFQIEHPWRCPARTARRRPR
jgi:hypothetical protein